MDSDCVGGAARAELTGPSAGVHPGGFFGIIQARSSSHRLSMASFSKWFRSKPRPGSRAGGTDDLDGRLEALERESKRADPGFQWGPLNRAGDLCLRAGDRARALEYYGRTIDTLLADEQREAARGVANKIIRVHAEAVRTLCTLTWLDLAARHTATALLHLRDYVEAAKRQGQESLASDEIVEMARVSPDEEFLGAAADALDRLDFPDKAGIVREWLRAGGSPDVLRENEELAARCLQAAIGANSERG